MSDATDDPQKSTATTKPGTKPRSIIGWPSLEIGPDGNSTIVNPDERSHEDYPHIVRPKP